MLLLGLRRRKTLYRAGEKAPGGFCGPGQAGAERELRVQSRVPRRLISSVWTVEKRARVPVLTTRAVCAEGQHEICLRTSAYYT
jgi:hypothetical protein